MSVESSPKRARLSAPDEQLDAMWQGPFALIQRSADTDLHYLSGNLEELENLDDIPLPADPGKWQSVSIVPFCQIRERGFKAASEGEKILSIRVKTHKRMSVEETLARLPPEEEVCIASTEFDHSEEAYEEIIRSIIYDQVYNGEGSSFVSPRACFVKVDGYSIRTAMSVFRRLLTNEYGSYWTFLFHGDDGHCFVGATPERQLMVSDGQVRMNPISGTYRKSDKDLETQRAEFLEFLKDQKEIDELYMVTDEELKMMARLCPEGGAVIGPKLIEMGFLIHTEYELVGSAMKKEAINLFRHTMFCPTVTGSPMGNACRVVNTYEKHSRRYYSSAIMVMGWDDEGGEYLDSAITIRTIEMRPGGRLDLRAGATITRDSDPRSEVLETIAKQRGALTAIQKNRKPLIQILSPGWPSKHVLDKRNLEVCRFWLQHNAESSDEAFRRVLKGKKVVLTDNEDDFVWMVSHLFACHGAKTSVIPTMEFNMDTHAKDAWCVVLGPGPGDPNSDIPRMKKLHQIAETCFKRKQRTFGVCLGHQLMCKFLGFKVPRKDKPLQGIQKTIKFFGQEEKVGFYNSFCPIMDEDVVKANPDIKDVVVEGEELLAVRGAHFTSYQFHPESILTKRGEELIGQTIEYLSQATGYTLPSSGN